MKDCCANCIYCEVKPKGEFHYGTHKDSVDFWCHCLNIWLKGDASGKCKNYK